MTISINGVNQSVPSKEDHGGGVKDITELKTVGPSLRFDRQERYVEDETRPYYFDIQSVSAESLPDIVDPGDSPAAGRWIRLPAGAGGVPGPHAITHKGGGTDEIAAVTGVLNGLMIAADKLKLDTIAAGAEVNVVDSVFGRVGAVVAVANDYAHAQLSAIGTDDHHAKLHAADHVTGGPDKIRDATAAVDGLATAVQIAKLNGIAAGADVTGANAPQAHRTSHISGGGDAFLATELLESITKRIQTSTGPTTLVVGAVADGEFLKRVGATIVGAAAGVAPVTSVFGRVGVVVAVAGDYDSTEVTNVSGVFGGTVTSALDTLDTGKLNLAGDTMTGTLTLLSIIKATGGNDLEVQDDTGTTSFRVRATNGRVVFSKDLESNASDSLVIGKAGAQWKEIRVGIVTPGAGKTLTLTHGVAELAFGDGTQSNETLMLGLTPTTTGNMFLITDVARIGSFDFTYAVRSKPTLGLQSGAAAPGEIAFLFHDGSDFIIDNAKSAADSLMLLTGGAVRMDISSGGVIVHSDILPNSNNSRTIGDSTIPSTNAFHEIVCNLYRAGSGQNLTLQGNGGVFSLEILNSSSLINFRVNVQPHTDDARSIGIVAKQFKEIIVGIVRPGTTGGAKTLTLQSQDASPAIVITDTEITMHDDIKLGSDNALDIGDSTNVLRRIYTNKVRPANPDALGIEAADGTKRIEINNTGIGFFQAAPIAKPAVTGSRGGNAALADLLTDLALLGLITDSSS